MFCVHDPSLVKNRSWLSGHNLCFGWFWLSVMCECSYRTLGEDLRDHPVQWRNLLLHHPRQGHFCLNISHEEVIPPPPKAACSIVEQLRLFLIIETHCVLSSTRVGNNSTPFSTWQHEVFEDSYPLHPWLFFSRINILSASGCSFHLWTCTSLSLSHTS